jgi:hypothetical protein
MDIKKEVVGQVYSYEFDWNMITQKAIDQSVEGKDYIILPLKIKLLEYNGYEI